MNVLLEFEKNPLSFSDPKEIISCYHPGELKDCFQQIEAALARGYYLAGFLSYEAGYSFEETLLQNKNFEFPLLYMGVYEGPDRQRLWSRQKPDKAVIRDLTLSISRKDYDKNIQIIHDHIFRGDVYQITYCLKYFLNYAGDKRVLYDQLMAEQPVPYPAYIEADDFQILSLSPERFFYKKGDSIITEPMKGTWPRGSDLWSDKRNKETLHTDPKNRAENLMITDLLRNDLGRIGCNVKVPELFKVTGYRTVYQMTSVVTANIPENIALYELFAALFPSGSVTGAPKIRAMQIIREIENTPRNIYTGAIGYITPQREMFFNIPIRTLLFRGEEGELGIGGGIVWDSTAQGEWDEGLLKARFVTEH